MVVVVGAPVEVEAAVVEDVVASRAGLDEQAANPNEATTMPAVTRMRTGEEYKHEPENLAMRRTLSLRGILLWDPEFRAPF